MKLEDEVAVVTGAAQGIGEATAKLFAEEGAKVVVADYNVKAGEKTVADIEAKGNEALFCQVDVADFEAAKQLVNTTVEKYGSLDILVNNAGVTADGFLTGMSEEDWDKVIDVNLKGVFNCTRHAANQMMEQESGVILNASSVVGLYGNIAQTNYAATKFGVIGLTKTWAKELGSEGIRVNAVAPGFVETPMAEAVPDKILDNIIEQTPQDRLAKPKEIAKAYCYLASEDASFVNGEVLTVDGGLVLN